MNLLETVALGVTETPHVHPATVKLVQNIAAQVQAHSTNPSFLESFAAMLHLHAGHLADHALANSPVVTATHPIPVRFGAPAENVVAEDANAEAPAPKPTPKGGK